MLVFKAVFITGAFRGVLYESRLSFFTGTNIKVHFRTRNTTQKLPHQKNKNQINMVTYKLKRSRFLPTMYMPKRQIGTKPRPSQ